MDGQNGMAGETTNTLRPLPVFDLGAFGESHLTDIDVKAETTALLHNVIEVVKARIYDGCGDCRSPEVQRWAVYLKPSINGLEQALFHVKEQVPSNDLPCQDCYHEMYQGKRV